MVRCTPTAAPGAVTARPRATHFELLLSFAFCLSHPVHTLEKRNMHTDIDTGTDTDTYTYTDTRAFCCGGAGFVQGATRDARITTSARTHAHLRSAGGVPSASPMLSKLALGCCKNLPNKNVLTAPNLVAKPTPTKRSCKLCAKNIAPANATTTPL